MNTDAFEGSETVERTPSGNTAAEVRQIMNPSMPEHIDEYSLPRMTGYSEAVAPDAAAQDMRLKRCGLVWHEDQLNGHRWVARPLSDGRKIITDRADRVKILPLFMVKPTPGLEIEALDGEKYLLPKDFKGNWFAIKSPKGRELIP